MKAATRPEERVLSVKAPSGGRNDPRRDAEPGPRVVYARPPVLLATVVERAEDGWRVRIGTQEQIAGTHDAVDPALIDDAIGTGAPVVIDNGTEPRIAGVLLTSRPLTIDRDGSVLAKVKRLVVEAEEEALFKTSRAFVQVTAREVELYGVRVAARARDVVKLLGAMVKLN